MLVLFIFPVEEEKFYAGIGILSAFLKQHGHKTALAMEIIKTPEVPPESLQRIKKKIEEVKPGLIGMPSYDSEAGWTRQVAKMIKKDFPHIPTVVGGYWATLSPEDVLSDGLIDYACVGEGEDAMLELVEALEAGKSPEKIKNICMKKDGKVIKNQCRPLIEDLDLLPFPDRELFDYQKIIDSYMKFGYTRARFASFIAGRGCPYSCTYCSNHAFRELYPNKDKYTRMRSPDNVLAEIEEVGKKYDFETVLFMDDTFVVFRDWLEEFCSKYKARFKYPYICNGRVNLCSLDVLKLLKDSGCQRIQVGIESGDNRVRNNVLGRNMTNAQIIEVFSNAHKLGIETYSHNMIGLPYEGRYAMFKTLLLNMRIRPNHVQVSIYYPFKNTNLGDLCFDSGWVNEAKARDTHSYYQRSILDRPGISAWEVSAFYKVFRGSMKVSKGLDKMGEKAKGLIGLNKN